MVGHVFIAGKTQSGKTYMMKKYLQFEKKVFILATKSIKGRFTYNEIPSNKKYEFTTLAKFPTKAQLKKFEKFIYIPNYNELEEVFYNEFFKKIFFLEIPSITVIDEAMQVCKNAFSIPKFYKALLTQGQERKQYVWSLTQRPSNIPQLLLSESTHYFIFALNSIDDRTKISKWTGHDEFLEKLTNYKFRYYNNVTDFIDVGIIK